MDSSEQTRACRKKGSGTLQLRGNKFLAIWTVNGKRYTRSTGTGDREEAEKKLAEFTKPFQEKTELEIIENLQAKVRVKESQIKDTRNRELPPLKLKFMVDKYKEDLSTGNITDSTENSYQNLLNVFIRETELEFAYQVDEEVAKKSAKKGEETAKKKSTYKNTAAKLESCKKRIKTIADKIRALCKKMEVEKKRLAELQNKANRKERMDFMKGVTDEQLEAFKAFLAQQKQTQE